MLKTEYVLLNSENALFFSVGDTKDIIFRFCKRILYIFCLNIYPYCRFVVGSSFSMQNFSNSKMQHIVYFRCLYWISNAIANETVFLFWKKKKSRKIKHSVGFCEENKYDALKIRIRVCYKTLLCTDVFYLKYSKVLLYIFSYGIL